MQKENREKILRKGFTTLISYLREFRGLILFTSTLAILQAVAEGFAPFLLGRLFDAILVTDEFFKIFDTEISSWLFFILLLSFAWLAGGMLGWIVDRKRRSMGTDLAAIYRAQAAARLIRLPLDFHKSEKSGEILERIERGGNAAVNIIEQIAITLAPEILSATIGLTIAFFINPILAGILLTGVVVYLIILSRLVPPIVTLQKEGHKRWRESWGLAIDAITNYQGVKQATAEEYEEKRIREKYLHGAAAWWKKVEYIWSGISFYQRIIVVITQIIVISLSVYFIRIGEISIGDLIALNGYAGMLFGPFVRLGHYWQTIQNGLVNIQIAEEMFSKPAEKAYTQDARKIKKVKGNIVFQGVSFSYKDALNTPVLKNISFKVNSGEVVALVGESGVGKSTAIELLSGYYYPTEGEVLVDGENVKNLDLASLRKNIAVVSQEPVLFNDSIEANIKYGAFSAKKSAVIEAAKDAHADTFIEKFPKKYKTLVGERGIKLSVGQKQRIAIARAILRNPSILILDEPTSALDARTEQLISESLEKLMEGRTTFIIAHRLSTVRRADKILVFDKGRIVEEGKHEDLIKKETGVYRRLYEYQVGLHN